MAYELSGPTTTPDREQRIDLEVPAINPPAATHLSRCFLPDATPMSSYGDMARYAGFRSICLIIPEMPPCNAYTSKPILAMMNAAAALRSPVLQ